MRPTWHWVERNSPCTEIDHNFSRSHRIVTSSILPIVEQYANHSREVWEGSKVWALQLIPTSPLTSHSSGNNSSSPAQTYRCQDMKNSHTTKKTILGRRQSPKTRTTLTHHQSRDLILRNPLRPTYLHRFDSRPRSLQHEHFSPNQVRLVLPRNSSHKIRLPHSQTTPPPTKHCGKKLTKPLLSI